ncbi:lysM domain receptor-like kinase 4 [Juglans microcarpa x Juglans regia]|uniref:lysM domain receptor-like kinase 4 n=1 Tax=Juglans microcarpa x Juglans regia TaxID=2249226 RepID=UPI001B7EBA48|nr:lysM domain receptor-like kinase 4 [Juglans microcarpa x Juglans regia]
MNSPTLIFVLTILLFSSCSLILAQQPYEGKVTTDCGNNANSALGYSCNGLNTSCQGYLTFRSQPPYNSVSAISALLASDPSQLSQIISVSETATFETNKLVLVPVNCSCSGHYYQANASYVIKTEDTYLLIANNIFQALSTCQALQNQSSHGATSLPAGATINVPLRCACPTKNQIDVNVNYLLTYLVAAGDYVASISERFGSSTEMTLAANELSAQNPTIYYPTTLLVPLQDPPSSSQTIEPPPPPPLASPPPPPSSESSSKTWVYVLVGVLGGSALVLVFGTVIFCVFFRKSKKKSDSVIVSDHFEAHAKPEKKKVEEESEDFLESISSMAQSLKVYSFKELQDATDDFSPSCWIQGSVYRGKFNGDLAAIKKMNGDVSREINLLNKINHSNIICLSGICFNNGHWYLVYEYAANGPLSDWIYNSSSSDRKILSWTQRMQIVLDVATGLNYLHGFTAPPHVHKDIKSSNILLDGDLRAKIANFGLARSAQGQEGQFSLTKHIVGTRGYMAPEYLENGFVSTKLDAYALGVVMLEIVTGKEVAALYEEENMQLSDVLSVVLREEDVNESLRHFMDPSLRGNYPLELAVFVVRLIDSCLNKNPAGRPAMDEIVQSLSRTCNASLTWESTN